VRGILAVLGTAVFVWLALAGPAALLGGTKPEVTGSALVVCLAPNLLALLVARLVRTQSQVTQTGVVLASFLIRPLIALGLGFAVYYAWPELKGHEVSLLLWGVMFYLLLLIAESYVVSRQVADSNAGR